MSLVECPVSTALINPANEKVSGGAFHHLENGVLLQMIWDIMLIVLKTKETHPLLN
jgi:hypothetical protein